MADDERQGDARMPEEGMPVQRGEQAARSERMDKSTASPEETARMRPAELKEREDTAAANAIRERLGQKPQRERVRVSKQEMEAAIREWPAGPLKIASSVIEKYGAPAEACVSRLIWYDAGPWKRVMVLRDEIRHDFPNSHADSLMQTIDYRVPVDRVADVLAFNGSIIVDRTAGEVSVRCDSEETNIMSLNLMHEVVTGKMSVEEVRRRHSEGSAAHMMSRNDPYAERFMFDAAVQDTADKDKGQIAGAVAKEVLEKIKDVFK